MLIVGRNSPYLLQQASKKLEYTKTQPSHVLVAEAPASPARIKVHTGS